VLLHAPDFGKESNLYNSFNLCVLFRSIDVGSRSHIIDVIEMSLKAFHVFFIIVATLFTLWFGFWGLQSYLHTGNVSHLWMAGGALVGAVLLIWYFRWFLKKLKNESYL